MKTYLIEIDEEQRVLLMEALCQLRGDNVKELYDLFEGLPAEEEAHPEIIHGFCY